MKELLTGISPQPDFPVDDLTEDNAALLEFMMANIQVTQSSHEMAELASPLIRMGHQSSMCSAARIYDEPNRRAAVNHGISMFESLIVLVNGKSDIDDRESIGNIFAKTLAVRDFDLTTFMGDSVDTFVSESPRTVEVISLSSKRFHGSLVSYAILGAALSRRFGLDCFKKAS